MEELPRVTRVDADGNETAAYDPSAATLSDGEQADTDLFDAPVDAEDSGDTEDSSNTDTADPEALDNGAVADDEPIDPADEPEAPEPEPGSTVPVVVPTIVERYPHDSAAFTQGLEFGDGLLIESLGLVGESARRQVQPTTGEVIGSARLDADQFGAGLTVIDTQIIQLTWQQGVAVVADLITLIELGRFTYEGEGWGICGLDDGRLVMSNGSGLLTFRDPETFEVDGELEVTRDGVTVSNLNELECVGSSIYANVWLESDILEIDVATGQVIRVIDASALVPGDVAPDDVLNGIAFRAETDTFFVTGKRWTVMYEVTFG